MNDKEMVELPFIEAVRIFKAEIQEKAEPLHDNHHEQVKLAINDFHQKQLADSAEKNRQSVDAKIPVTERQAINFLASLKALRHLDNETSDRLQLAMEAIAIGKFQKLPKMLNKLSRAVKKSQLNPDIVLNKALEIINEYPLVSDTTQTSEQLPITILQKPEIILSESFIEKQE
jgi:hypothetical protein